MYRAWKSLIFIPALFLSVIPALSQTKLSPKWEELTAPDFVLAIKESQGVCVLPFGIIEKHGPHLPLGTDLLDVRFATLNAVQQEYAVVFPEYYFGQIFEARQQPGDIAGIAKWAQLACWRAEAAQDLVDDTRPIDRVVNGQPHARVFEGGDAVLVQL